ncbi:MAG: sigma-70 family RNA polymerase sigma factor [Spirochaetales bacterium]|nr:sigma-70 family RNA polymerase sigma factor [Spirochaetales bacterium]
MKIISFPETKSGVSREEYAEVYDNYATRIYQFIYYKTYHKETAEDLTSQTFLRALEKLHLYNPEKGSMSAWIYQIARNLVTDYYRSTRKTVDIDDVWDLAGKQNIELDSENKEQLEELREVLKKLPSEQRDILILRIWQDLSYKEIANIIGKSEGACKMMFSRIIAKLRKELSVAVLLLLFLLKSKYQ